MAKSLATQGVDLHQKRSPGLIPKALNRCDRRWCDLFFGVLEALEKRDPKLVVGLREALKGVGLADDFTFKPELFDLNPSDETLERVKRFKATAKIPNLKGKTRRRIDPGFALHVWAIVWGAVQDVPRKGFASPKNLESGSSKNVKQRYWALRDRCSKMRERLSRLDVSLPSDGQLNKWSNLRNKRLAYNITGRLLSLKVPRLKKILYQATKRWPHMKGIRQKGFPMQKTD